MMYFIIIKQKRKGLKKSVEIPFRKDVVCVYVCFYNNKIQIVTFNLTDKISIFAKRRFRFNPNLIGLCVAVKCWFETNY